MDDKTWDSIEYGIHNYQRLIDEAGARPLSQEEDKELEMWVVKSFPRKGRITWSKVLNKFHKDTKHDYQNCDKYFQAAVHFLNVSFDEQAWICWEGHEKSLEIPVGNLINCIVPALFVSQGTYVAGLKSEWLIEYDFYKEIHAAYSPARSQNQA